MLSGHLITTTDTYNQYKRRAAFDWEASWDYTTHDWAINWYYTVEILASDVPTSSTYMSPGKWSITVNGVTQSGDKQGAHCYHGNQFAKGTFHLPADTTFAISGYVYIGANPSQGYTGDRHNLINSGGQNIDHLGPSPEDVPPEERTGVNVYYGINGVPKRAVAIYYGVNGVPKKVLHCYIGTESGIKQIF